MLDIFTNKAFLACMISWFCAQACKVVLARFVDGKWDLHRFWGLGGMPSSHTSVTCTLALSAGLMRGFGSLEFTITLIFACIVMTDAAGVRREAGQHARLINEIIQEMIEEGKGLSPENLKVLLGHSPFEVTVGALLGILVAILFV